MPAMESLVGPVAYRGRNQMIQRKSGRAARPMGRTNRPREIMSTNLQGKEFHTILSVLKGNLEQLETSVRDDQAENIQQSLTEKGQRPYGQGIIMAEAKRWLGAEQRKPEQCYDSFRMRSKIAATCTVKD